MIKAKRSFKSQQTIAIDEIHLKDCSCKRPKQRNNFLNSMMFISCFFFILFN